MSAPISPSALFLPGPCSCGCACCAAPHGFVATTVLGDRVFMFPDDKPAVLVDVAALDQDELAAIRAGNHGYVTWVPYQGSVYHRPVPAAVRRWPTKPLRDVSEALFDRRYVDALQGYRLLPVNAATREAGVLHVIVDDAGGHVGWIAPASVFEVPAAEPRWVRAS